MNTHSQTYNQRADRFGEVVDRVAADSWSAQSPCEKWTAADVVDHVIDSQRDFCSRHDVRLGARPEGTPRQAWHAHVAAVGDALGDGALLDTEFDGYFGPTTLGDTLADFYGFDMIVHRWDLARATGQEAEFTEAEMDLLEASIAGFGEHLYADGVCAPAVPVAAGAPRQQRLLGTLGRGSTGSTGG
ncbi:MAG TPA: TIGR03086 family metal-binding protein [Nocardioidaceae bacterium]|nr:TIGR03086 family metal-binding protein [Nocardioidaceae bacterium]